MDLEQTDKVKELRSTDEEDIKLKVKKSKKTNYNRHALDKRKMYDEIDEKKPFEDVNNFQSNILNEKTLKYFQDLVVNHRIKKRKVFFEKTFKTWIIIIFYMFSSLMNIISILLFIIDNQISDHSNIKNTLQTLDFLSSIFFTFEFALNFLFSEKKLIFFFRFDTIIDLLTIIPSYLSYLYNNTIINLSFMRIFRVLRVLRVLRLLKYVNMLKSDDEQGETTNNSGLRINKVNKQIISFIVSLVSTIFVSAGTVTLLQNYIPGSFNVSNLTFIDAVYFVIVTSSTLGYGDIVPTNTTSRMLVIILLIYLIYFFSEQIASIVTLLRITNNSVVSFNFEKHNIIIGDLSAESIKSFLDEYYEIYNYNSKNKTKPYTILLLDERNSNIRDNLSLEPYENKVQFLVTKNYSIEAFIKSNFEEAESIICLNHNYK